MKPSRRHAVSKKEARALAETLERILGRREEFEVAEIAVFQDFEIYLVDGKPVLARVSGELIPLLNLLVKLREPARVPVVYVDRGAAKALARGADLMAPGVRGVEGEFSEGAIVVVADEETKAPVMVGRALVSSEDLKRALESRARGRVVESLHYVGDEIWKAAMLL
ncbi:MAG: DUF1947 domain-containing protein [Acidilobaceae archaeon]